MLEFRPNKFGLFTKVILTFILALFIFSSFSVKNASAAAGINRTINFQGKLVNNPTATNVSNSTYSVVFTFYDRDSGGTALWSETQSVTTADGIFRVALGSVTPFPSNFNFNWSGLYLGVKVGADSEMTPRIQLAAVPFAFNAEKVAGLTVQDDAGNASTSATLQIANSKTVTFKGTNGLTFNDSNAGGTTVSFPSVASLTLVGEATSQVLTNKTIGSTGLTFSGATTDITTAANEDFVLSPNGSGKIGFNTTTPLSSIDLRGNPVTGGTLSIASVSGRTSFATLVVNNDGVGDIFTASASGTAKFVIQSTGFVGIGLTNPNNFIQVANLINFDNSKWNTFLGYQTGFSNPTGSDNTLIGYQAGKNTTLGSDNLFVGYQSGLNNNSGDSNVFLGSLSGTGNTTGVRSVYVGYAAGSNNLGGSENSFLGYQAGASNTYGTYNTFLGYAAGQTSSLGGSNTLLGANSDTQFASLVNASAVGANALVSQSDSLILGSIAGVNAATGSAKIGIGITSPNAILNVAGGFGANALVIFNQKNNSDIFAASASGTTKFLIANNGDLTLTGGVWIGGSNGSGLCIKGGATVSWGTCGTGGGGGDSWWNELSGAISPLHLTDDLLFGTTLSTISTSSALYSFTGVKTGQTQASISGQLIVTANNGYGGNASIGAQLVLGAQTGNANIQSTKNQGLTFGGNTTGNITFLPGNGTGTVTIGTATNGLTFDVANGGPSYYGTARILKTITLSPEYAGAVLTASGSSTTTGNMTSDASPSANWRTYYEWVGTGTGLQDYTVAVRVTLPNDFSDWQPTNAITLDYETASNLATANKLDFLIYNPSDPKPSTPVVMRTGVVSATGKTWGTLIIPSSALTAGVAKWNTASQSATFYIKMYGSGSVNYTHIGDINLNYVSKF